jgi:hypothetical protein
MHTFVNGIDEHERKADRTLARTPKRPLAVSTTSEMHIRATGEIADV